MSYILDALKRAEVERERERSAAPGLHTLHPLPINLPADSGNSRVLWWALGVGLASAALVSGLWFWRSSANLPPSATPVTLPASVPAPRPSAPSEPMQVQAPTTAATPPLTPLPTSEPGTHQASTNPTSAPQPVTTLQPPATATKTPAALASKADHTIKVAAPEALPQTPLLTELAPALRHPVPKITITGSVYSDTPSHRLLLVNNLVLAQGNLVAPELMLEEIQPHSSVFSFKGTRFRVMH